MIYSEIFWIPQKGTELEVSMFENFVGWAMSTLPALVISLALLCFFAKLMVYQPLKQLYKLRGSQARIGGILILLGLGVIYVGLALFALFVALNGSLPPQLASR